MSPPAIPRNLIKFARFEGVGHNRSNYGWFRLHAKSLHGFSFCGDGHQARTGERIHLEDATG
jgi:hypothetical protein